MSLGYRLGRIRDRIEGWVRRRVLRERWVAHVGSDEEGVYVEFISPFARHLVYVGTKEGGWTIVDRAGDMRSGEIPYWTQEEIDALGEDREFDWFFAKLDGGDS